MIEKELISGFCSITQNIFVDLYLFLPEKYWKIKNLKYKEE